MRILPCLLGAGLALVPSLPAQQYAIDWHSLGSTGGEISASPYTLTGTLGQPDAAPALAGGPYALTGGFWSRVSASPSPPTLSMVTTGVGVVIVCWSHPADDWLLLENDRLEPAGWVPSPSPVLSTGEQHCVTLTPTAGHRFFILQQP